MALLSFVLTSLAALFASFLSLAPTSFHGLGPWIDTLGTRPVAPTPAATPKAFSSSDFWEAFPTANLSAFDIKALLALDFSGATPTADPPTPEDVLLAPAPTSSFVPEEEEVGGQAFPEPPEEPTVEELLRELWWLIKQAVLCLTLNINDFLREHGYLGTQKTSCCFPIPDWEIPPLSRSRSRSRGRFTWSQFAVPFAPAPAVAAPPSPTPSSPTPSSPTPSSPTPSSPTSPPSLPPSPLVSPSPLALLPASSSSPPASPQARSRSSSANQSCRPELVDRLRWNTARREQEKRIHELEDEVDKLASQLEEMRRPPPPSPPPPSPPPPSPPSPSPPPPPPQFPRVQPVFITGTALPPPPPPPRFPPGQSKLSASSAPFFPSGSGYRPQGSNFGYPPPGPFPQQRPNLPPGYGQPLRPDQLSPDDFRKKYPLTGTKKQT